MGKLSVVIVDATGNKEQKVGLPDDVAVQNLIMMTKSSFAVNAICRIIKNAG